MDLDKMICPCMGVTVGDIKSAVDNGSVTVEDVKDVTMASSCCGRCTDEIEQLIKEFV